MGLFLVGITIGILISAIIFIVLAYFRSAIEHRVVVIEKYLESKGPRQHGEIIMPKSDVEIARENIINKNKALGRDTPIDELR